MVPVRTNTRATRKLYLVAAGLVFTLGAILFGLSTRTDQYFAWTIRVPLTAAFLGASYLGSGFGEIAAARRQVWAESRIAVPSVLLFSALTGVLTLLHREQFHFGSGQPLTARVVAWAWTVVYVGFPLATAVILVGQLRVQGPDLDRGLTPPPWFRSALIATGALMLGVGGALFLAPASTRGIWPWPLTDLTARAIGAWGIALGVGNLHAAMENDWDRIRVAMPFLAGVGVLALAAIARYPHAVDWTTPAAWLLMAVLLALAALGGYGVRAGRSPSAP